MTEILLLGFIVLDLAAVLLILRHFGKVGLFCFYIAHVILVQLTVQIQVDFFGYTVVVGSMLFAALFLITDVLTEHYGKKEGYIAVGLGASSLVLFLSVVGVTNLLIPDGAGGLQGAFVTLFDGQPRVTISDLIISYIVFQSFDVWLYHKIHTWTGNKHLWLRNCGSTFSSQILVAIIFFQVAFAGTIDQKTLWEMILAGLAMKLFVAVLDTPFMYWSYNFLPKRERYYKISVYEGRDAILQVWESMKTTFEFDSKGEVLLSGVNDTVWKEKYGNELTESLAWRDSKNIITRCLIAEGDHYTVLGSEYYRAVPKHAFAQTPFYIYKDNVALINWQGSTTVVHIVNADIAETFRRQFEFNWEHGKQLR
jgi:queuosine precursor transporter